MAITSFVSPRHLPITLGFDPQKTYPETHRIVPGKKGLIQTEAKFSTCFNICCFIFCCIRSNYGSKDQVLAIDRFSFFLDEKYGAETSAFAQKILGISLIEARSSMCLPTNQAALLVQYCNHIQQFGIATCKLIPDYQLIKPVSFKDLKTAASKIKEACDLEFISSIFRVYTLYARLLNGTSLETLSKEAEDRSGDNSIAISKDFIIDYLCKIKKMHIFSEEATFDFFLEALPKDIHELELNVAFVMNKLHYRFSPSILAFNPDALYASGKLTEAEWRVVKVKFSSEWDLTLIRKIYNEFAYAPAHSPKPEVLDTSSPQLWIRIDGPLSV